MTQPIKLFLVVAWILFFVVAILAFAAPACSILTERNRELSSLVG